MAEADTAIVEEKPMDFAKLAATDEQAVVDCQTTAGNMTWELYRAWSPHGYDRLTALFEANFFDGSHFFRAVENFLVQFGISYSENEELIKMANKPIPDDPKLPGMIFHEGTIAYAGSGKDSRTSQLFMAYAGGARGLGRETWETPVGKVVKGMEETVKQLYKGKFRFMHARYIQSFGWVGRRLLCFCGKPSVLFIGDDVWFRNPISSFRSMSDLQ